jgi:hypothetical protein
MNGKAEETEKLEQRTKRNGNMQNGRKKNN